MAFQLVGRSYGSGRFSKRRLFVTFSEYGGAKRIHLSKAMCCDIANQCADFYLDGLRVGIRFNDDGNLKVSGQRTKSIAFTSVVDALGFNPQRGQYPVSYDPTEDLYIFEVDKPEATE